MQGDDPESSALKGKVNEIAPADSNGLGDCPSLIGRQATLCGIHLKHLWVVQQFLNFCELCHVMYF
eukprot:scaffold24585_cov97-Skeletonema_menzelii.AAC.1